MTPYEQWQSRYPAAASELHAILMPQSNHVHEQDTPEAIVQANVRLEASQKGDRLWRNNVGAGKIEGGSYVRWGLCNDSVAVNAALKSGDLIGLRRVKITPEMVGTIIAQFVSIECKKPGWHYTGTPRELAQLHWAELIYGLGGYAAIVTGPGSL